MATIDKELRNWRDLYGYLPDWAIANMIQEEVIGINPLAANWEDNIGPMSIDFHLGKKALVPKRRDWKVIDIKSGVSPEDYDEVKLREGQSLRFKSGQFIVTEVEEHLKLPKDVVGFLDGKSSLARLGLVVHLTAGRFDPGWDGVPVLELKNNSFNNILVPVGWPVCAFIFFRLMSEVDKSYAIRGRYHGFTGVHSLVERDEGK